MKLFLPPAIRSHLGKIIGVLLGLLFGLRLFGVLFGFLIGALVDILLRELRLRKSLQGSADSFLSERSPQLQFVLLISRLALHTALLESSRSTANLKTDRRSGTSKEGATLHGMPPPEATPHGKGFPDAHDLDFLQELAVRSLPLSIGGKSAVRQFFRVYRENPASLTDLYSPDSPGSPGSPASPPPKNFKLKASEQIAVSRLLFGAAQIGGGKPEISGSTYRFIVDQCSRMGIENRCRDIAAGILKARDTTSYELLGVDPDTPPEELRRVYRTLAAQFHPDSLHGLSREQQEAAAEAFLRIRDAYEKIISE